MVAQDRPKINPLFRGIVKQNKIKQANKKTQANTKSQPKGKLKEHWVLESEAPSSVPITRVAQCL